MNKQLPLFLLIIFIIGSCAPVPVSPTMRPTSIVIPTRTPLPTQPAIPTVTPYPLLRSEGPYLLVFIHDFNYDNQNFTILDADGRGRKYFQLPNDGYIYDIRAAVSPDGKWLAYYTGSIEKPYDLTLNLLNLEDETTYQIANLLAPGYPENLMLTTLNKDLCPVEHPDCQKGAIPSDFASAIIRTIDWSPDSQTLAFAAQIDGPSSDVYLFKIADKSIRRLINDLENVWSVEWSPDGEKILYTNFQSGNYMRQELYIADPNIQMVQSSKLIHSGSFWSGEGWIDENSYFLWDGGEGAPPHRFRYINTKTQQVTVFWKYESDGFVYLKDLGGIVVNVHPNQEDTALDSIEPGTYFVSISGEYTKLSDNRYLPLSGQSLEDSFFLTTLGKLLTMKLDGSITPPMSENINPADLAVSPNKEWFVLNKNNAQIELCSKNLQLIQSWDIESYTTIWRPDSTGFFLRGNSKLYYVSMKDNEFKLVDVCPSEDCSFADYVWLP